MAISTAYKTNTVDKTISRIIADSIRMESNIKPDILKGN